MTFLNEGINRLRDLFIADIDKGQLGTDGTAASESDTGLIAGDATTVLDITTTSSDKSVKVDYTLPSTGGTTGTYKEFAIRRSTAPVTDYSRIVMTGISWTAGGTEELNISQIIYFDQE